MVFPEFFGSLDRLRSQMPTYNYSATPAVPRSYFADGPVGVYVKDVNENNKLAVAGDTVNLYIGMRRGGRFTYALDVNNPDAPKLLWKKSNADAGFEELGQTWSEPKVGKLEAASGITDPVVIFGAGYGPEHEDTLPATSNDKGRGVFILNALTGAVIKQFVSGSFLIGLLMPLLTERFIVNPQWRLLLVVGFLGAYTTFSTFEYETGALLKDGQWLYAGLNVMGSVVAGFIALKIGEIIAKSI